MSLVRWSPMISALNRWPSIWDDEDLNNYMSSASNNLDVFETDNEVVVKANVAGVSADKIEVMYEKGVLTITANAAEESSDEKKKHYSKSSWQYSYRVAVPGMLDHTAEPSAEVKDGVITLTFKKAEASKPKKLTVKTA